MKQIIILPEITGNQKQIKGVEFTHFFNHENYGWKPCTDTETFLPKVSKIIYLGKCPCNGDMFAAYYPGAITIYKGYLNNGTY